MIGHVLAAVQETSPLRIVTVVGHQRDQVGAHVHELVPEALLAVQEEQHGTGHAVRMAMDAIIVERPAAARHGARRVRRHPAARGRVADPRSPRSTRRPSARSASCRGAWRSRSATAASSATPRATSRRSSRRRTRPTSSARSREINSGILAFDAEFLLDALPRIGNDNAKGEYYLTDTVQLAREAGLHVGAHPIDDVWQTEGANDRVQLAALGAEMNRRLVGALDARRRDGDGPGDDLARRRRGAGRGRHDPARASSCSAPRSSRRTR